MSTVRPKRSPAFKIESILSVSSFIIMAHTLHISFLFDFHFLLYKSFSSTNSNQKQHKAKWRQTTITKPHIINWVTIAEQQLGMGLKHSELAKMFWRLGYLINIKDATQITSGDNI